MIYGVLIGICFDFGKEARDKVEESFRTLKINRVFDVIHSLTDNYNDKKERSDNEISPLSHLVEERRLERPTPTSRTWCATNCATPRCAEAQR